MRCERLKDEGARSRMKMNNDRTYDWAAKVTAEILNLHWDSECKAAQFQRIAKLIYVAMLLAEIEAREAMLEPSNN